MIDFFQMGIGICGNMLLIAALTCLIFQIGRRTPRNRVLIFTGSLGILLMPINGTVTAEYMRAFVGDLSITSWVLLFVFCRDQLAGGSEKILSKNEITIISLGAILAAIILYPSALGMTLSDTYVLGYASRPLILVLFLCAIAAWIFQKHIIAVILTLSATGYYFELLESVNLWDYLIDAPLCLFSIIWVLVRTLAWVITKSRATDNEAKLPQAE